ncbi:unnamed protein product [marine sediment metagenome]|uniref:Uncharacterized protein n=1 Tax=marine sediment metagenome TaxID=412755 RepID=X0YS23_9ZZZZ
MPEFIITVSDEELKALEWDIYDVQSHIQNAISEKARRTMGTLIVQNTDKNPKKVPKAEKELIIKELELETAKERTDRMEAKKE